METFRAGRTNNTLRIFLDQDNTLCRFKPNNTLCIVPSMKWYQYVKLEMKRQGITQPVLAELLGLTQGGLGHWLNGKRQPPLDKIIEIATILKLDRAKLGALLLEADEVIEPPQIDSANLKPRKPGSQLTGAPPVDLNAIQQMLDAQAHQIVTQLQHTLKKVRVSQVAMPLEDKRRKKKPL